MNTFAIMYKLVCKIREKTKLLKALPINVLVGFFFTFTVQNWYRCDNTFMAKVIFFCRVSLAVSCYIQTCIDSGYYCQYNYSLVYVYTLALSPYIAGNFGISLLYFSIKSPSYPIPILVFLFWWSVDKIKVETDYMVQIVLLQILVYWRYKQIEWK